MPLYEFYCPNCDLNFEDLLSVESDNIQCPKCSSNVHKLISRTLGIVKGSSNRSIDCIVGAGAEKCWQAIEKRKEKRKQKLLLK